MNISEKKLLSDIRMAIERYFKDTFKSFNFKHQEVKELIDDEIDMLIDETQDMVLYKARTIEGKAEELTAPTHTFDDEDIAKNYFIEKYQI